MKIDKNFFWGAMLCMVGGFVSAGCESKTEDRVIIPAPLEMKTDGGEGFRITPGTVISTDSESLLPVAEYLSGLFKSAAGFSLDITENNDKAGIRFITDSSMKPEFYGLKVNADGIEITSADSKGFFYAVQTLRMALPPQIEASETNSRKEWSIQSMDINDGPRFGYRGLMIDVARYFMQKNDMMKIIDCMAMLKLNKLHLHLTDDTGWRLEIKKYPRLTEIGGWRVDRGDMPFYERRNMQDGEKATVGGFYTQEDMKEIIRYAAERQIEIIPEIDVPAHSCAALAAYPELACPNVNKKINVLPGLGGRDTEIIYCAGNEKTFEFLDGVIDEVAELFPSEYIHMGGDEANKFYWKTCPMCQKRMKKEGIAHVEDLQGYFMQRVSESVKSRGKIMMGWDELTNSRIPEGTVIFGWQGTGNAALKAAEQGHKFILTPARLLYLIRYQGPQWFEPLTYFGNNLMKDIYAYEPVQDGWKEGYEDLLVGVQASMWTEFCNSTDEVTYMVFPRLAALADMAWRKKGTADWTTFQKGLDNFLAHLDNKGIRYSKSMYNIQHKCTPTGESVSVNLQCERTDVEKRYTTDGSAPNAKSNLVSADIPVEESTIINVASFKNGKQMGETLSLQIDFNKATGKTVESGNKDVFLLTNGVRGSKRQSDFEWCTWANSDAVFTIDLKGTKEIESIGIGCLTNYGMGVHKPKSIKVEISDDNKSFKLYGEREFSEQEIFHEGNFVEDIVFEGEKTSATYVRITAKHAGLIPENHFMRPGQISKFCFDEIMIK